MARGTSRSDMTPRSLARSKDVLDQFISRQEGIEGRKMSAAKVLGITANLLSSIDTYEDRMADWEEDMEKVAKPEKPAKELYEMADKLINFLERVAHHQSNDSSDYKNSNAMVAAYHALPESIKPLVTAPKGLVKRLYRGDEPTGGDNPTVAASFATSPRNVGFWGKYVYKGADIKSFDGIIDSTRIEKNFSGRSKILKTLERIQEHPNNLEVYAGEDEKIVFGIKWKKNIGDHDWMDANGRRAETFKARWKDRGGE